MENVYKLIPPFVHPRRISLMDSHKLWFPSPGSQCVSLDLNGCVERQRVLLAQGLPVFPHEEDYHFSIDFRCGEHTRQWLKYRSSLMDLVSMKTRAKERRGSIFPN